MTEFKKFRVGDLFEINKVVGVNLDSFSQDGDCDYITRTSLNRGIHSTVNRISNSQLLSSNTFSLGLLQMDFFYRENQWYAGQFVRQVVPKFEINQKLGLYFETIFNCFKKDLLRYLVKDIDNVFLSKDIELPVTIDGSPDWQKMESVVDTVEQQHVDTVDKTLSAAGFSSFEDTLLTSEEESLLKEWLVAQTNLERSASAPAPSALRLKLFKISELFEIQTGSLISNEMLIKGNTPRVSVKTSDNGVIGYYNNNDKLTLANHFISVNFMGNCYWHEEESSVEMKVHILKNQNLNTDSGMYITTVLNKLFHNKYSYGNQLSSGMLKNESYEILLPVGEDGNPDFEIISKLGGIFKKLSVRDLRQSLDEQLSKYQSLKNL